MRAKNSRVVEIFILMKLGIERRLRIERSSIVPMIPPGLREAPRAARLGREPANDVPIGEPVRGLVPVRNPIAARADHTVEYPTGHLQACAAIGCDDLVDERNDD